MNCFDYELSDLLPIVTELAEKYTSKESSSVTFECAKQLMEAVEYTIRENLDEEWKMREGENLEDIYGLKLQEQEISAKEAYENGLQILRQKMEYIRESFNEIALHFRDYGNENLRDTVMRGIPGFLKFYNLRFQPQNEILTMDYPILCQMELEGLCGVDVILKYLDGVMLDQDFLRLFPEDLVKRVLERYHSEYPVMMINLCEPMLNYVMGCLIAHKRMEQVEWTQEEYDRITDYVLATTYEQRKEDMNRMLEQMLTRMQCADASKMKKYLMYGVDRFFVDLVTVVEYDCVERLFCQDVTMNP